MAKDEQPFPVPEVEPEETKPKSGRPAKGSPEASAWAARMNRLRAENRRKGGEPKATAPKQKPVTATTTALAEVEASLREAFAKGGAMLYMPAPIPGTYLLNTGDDAAAIITRMAARNPKILAALQGSSNLMDYFAIGSWSVGLFVAFAVQAGRIPADAPIASTMGITAIADELLAAGALQVDEEVAPAGVTPLEQTPAWQVPTPPEVEVEVAEA